MNPLNMMVPRERAMGLPCFPSSLQLLLRMPGMPSSWIRKPLMNNVVECALQKVE